MADVCYGVLSEGDSSSSACEQSSRATRRRRIELHGIKCVADLPRELEDDTTTVIDEKRPVILVPVRKRTDTDEVIDNPRMDVESGRLEETGMAAARQPSITPEASILRADNTPGFGLASICGKRRDMEDAVAVHPNFCRLGDEQLHYFGVYDGHGCSHVAMRCSERLHEIVREELKRRGDQLPAMDWKSAMERSFDQMDKEVTAWNAEGPAAGGAKCRCQLQPPDYDAVGSTAAVAIVTPEKIVVANCGDSRAILSRAGKAVPLSFDHKPDRPDELNRIQEAGGRVINWDGPRVLGVLAMSRAIGDNYLKPYVTHEPEVTVVDRTREDECLILGTDGLWDVVSNETACGVGHMCLRKAAPVSAAVSSGSSSGGGERACWDAALLLTKLAIARHSTDNVSIVVVDLRKHDT
ncbi:hypothetical protein SAY87_013220 [Trapa incisa]|uniref:protein-serine/threonine phosphatase n=1 Tax=Trapa incisa TaxID=236973 RepID=A0AAN7KCV6_9MYRT|nr:hypothetical protein SAY87_013220 [Trapa incisa]